jgi:hypothetical protein
MSKETEILDKVRTNLIFINGNGYTQRLAKVYEGYIPLSASNEFDAAYYYLGNRKPVKYYNDNTPKVWQADIWIHVQLKAESGEGKLIRTYEDWIENIRKWLYASNSSVYSAGLTTDKWFTLSRPDGIISWNTHGITEIEPDIRWQENIAELTFKITINFEN